MNGCNHQSRWGLYLLVFYIILTLWEVRDKVDALHLRLDKIQKSVEATK